MKEQNTKLRLHLWTKEEHKENSIRECAEKVYIVAKEEMDRQCTWKMKHKLDKQQIQIEKDRFMKNFMKQETLDMRSPSLSYTEIYSFIIDVATNMENIIIDYICLDNNIYRYIDIHFKHLLSNGSIQIYIDGINYIENPTCYNIDRALATAINATDNSLKFKHAIASK